MEPIDLKGKIVFVIGVSGSGKTTVGKLLAAALEVPFSDADDFHPASNIEKMGQGIPLTDEDRIPWLNELNRLARNQIGEGGVIACSALKEEYRQRLMQSIASRVEWIYLKGTFDQILERMRQREGHFMKPNMLASQFDTLEAPKDAIVMEISNSPEKMVQHLTKPLNQMQTEIGLIGLGVMGKSLSRNLAQKGFRIAVFNRHIPGKEENVAVHFKEAYPEMEKALPFDDLSQFVQSMERPRKIILMVNAGQAVDAVLKDLDELLDPEDIIIDGGNSHFEDTQRRIAQLATKGHLFLGTGVSGGEEGALKGPSIMPSGPKAAYQSLKKYLEAIAAKDKEGLPCCTYIGPQGSGHFVKMIHNGIEYVEMQLLAECYAILKRQGRSGEEMALVFESWRDDLDSYLLQITVDILRKKEGNGYLLENILDKAGNKGTGNWATASIAKSGEPATLIPAALLTRYLSFFRERRIEISTIFPSRDYSGNISLGQLKDSYRFARIMNHIQGFSLIQQVSSQKNWQVNLSETARIWTAGCIIKSDFMKELVQYLKNDPNLLQNETLVGLLKDCHPSARQVAANCLGNEIHAPCLIEAVNYFHGLKTSDSPANLIQAQRDYFGAHTYQRKDDASGKAHHTEWK